jgi:solute carrier family 6 amino acid/orphan transporter-like 15/16/17/18/20
MTGKRPWIGWMICWKYISPLALIILIIAILYDMGDKGIGYWTFVACEQVLTVTPFFKYFFVL